MVQEPEIGGMLPEKGNIGITEGRNGFRFGLVLSFNSLGKKLRQALRHIILASGQQIQSQVASAGSGFILTADGYIATNCHVIADASSVQITLNDGTTYDAQIIGSDADYDIAILKVDPGG